MLTIKNNDRISYHLLSIAWKLFDSDKETNYFGTDKLLYEAEIHMIMHIRDNPNLHLSAIAEKIGVTRGAVSQIVMKLERKGMISKSKSPQNKSMTMLSLTPQGETAYQEHKNFHQKFDCKITELLKDASPEQLEFLRKFLTGVEQIID